MGKFTPAEPAVVLFSEKAWLQGALLSAVAYGVELILFMMSFYLLLKKISGSKDEKKRLFLLVYITVIFILGTIFHATNSWFIQLALIDNRNIPGGPNQYEVTMFSVDELGNICAVITTWLCDATIVWRYQVIYTWSSKYPLWAIMVFPYLLLLGSFVTGVLFLIQLSVGSPWKADSTISTVNLTIPFFSVSLSLNIILTGAIVLRLLLYRRRIGSVMGPSYGKHYTSAAAMIIESASICSAFSLLFLVPFALKYPLNIVFLQSFCVVQIVSVLLIIFRVAQGKGWTTESSNTINCNRNVSLLRFASHHSFSPSSPPVLESETKHSFIALDDRRVSISDESNDITVNVRGILEREAGSMA